MTAAKASVRLLPTRPVRLSLEALATRTGLHPDLLRRFVALGLIEPQVDAAGAWWFRPSDVRTVARVQRLRVGLGLNYASIGLVMDLLDEIQALHSVAARSARGRPAARANARTTRD